MIYITGDTHGEYGRFSNRRVKKLGMELGENDYVIVCGDFGLCWSKDKTFDYNCKFFEEKKYTTLWIQGNHENYDMIAEYPVEEWHGGKVRHIVRDKIILLERGQVFEIEGKTFFTFGGASCQMIGEYSIVVKLTSEGKLEMASKSIAGFTRELLRVDQELYPDEADRLFRLFIYNSTLFRNTQLELGELVKKERRELSDVDALKKCVEIFCSGMTGSKEEAAVLANTKQKIKDILHEYEQFQRANSYAKKMRG